MKFHAEQALYAATSSRGHDVVGCSSGVKREWVRALLDEAMERLGDAREPVRALHVLAPVDGFWPALRFEEQRPDAAGRGGAPDVHALFFSVRELGEVHPLLLDFEVEWPVGGELETVTVEIAPRAEGDRRLAASIVERVLRGERVAVPSDEDIHSTLHLAVRALPPARRAALSVASRAFNLRRRLDVTVVPSSMAEPLEGRARLGELLVAAVERGDEAWAHELVGLGDAAEALEAVEALRGSRRVADARRALEAIARLRGGVERLLPEDVERAFAAVEPTEELVPIFIWARGAVAARSEFLRVARRALARGLRRGVVSEDLLVAAEVSERSEERLLRRLARVERLSTELVPRLLRFELGRALPALSRDDAEAERALRRALALLARDRRLEVARRLLPELIERRLEVAVRLAGQSAEVATAFAEAPPLVLLQAWKSGALRAASGDLLERVSSVLDREIGRALGELRALAATRGRSPSSLRALARAACGWWRGGELL